MKQRLTHIVIVVILIAASTVQGMQICCFYPEEINVLQTPRELAFDYQDCCNGSKIKTMPLLDTATVTQKFSTNTYSSQTALFPISIIRYQFSSLCLLNANIEHSTSPPLFILNASMLI